MNMFSPAELAENYAELGVKKTTAPVWKLFLLGALAGFLIGMAAAATNTAAHAITNISAVRIICGVLFPFGLAMVTLLGGELFTGNCMIPMSILEGKTTISGMLRNWACVYTGNFFGALLLAAGCAFFGQMNHSDGGLAAFTIGIAVLKCSFPFMNAIVLGILCNLLVCIAVLCASSAKDTVGKIFGAYVPIAFFVLCGFEHSIANMYYIPAGLFAMRIPMYAAKAAELGVNAETLTWGNFFLKNLIPVTVGNIIGGVLIGLLIWACYLSQKANKQRLHTGEMTVTEIMLTK